MDEVEVSWSTPIVALVACAVGGVALGIAAIAVPNDKPGQLLVGLAAVGLLGIAGIGFATRPKFALLTDGSLRIKRLRGADVYTPAEIRGVRVVRYPRLGRRVPFLELDVDAYPGAPLEDDRLLVFGRWDLGVAPEDVLDALTERGFAA